MGSRAGSWVSGGGDLVTEPIRDNGRIGDEIIDAGLLRGSGTMVAIVLAGIGTGAGEAGLSDGIAPGITRGEAPRLTGSGRGDMPANDDIGNETGSVLPAIELGLLTS